MKAFDYADSGFDSALDIEIQWAGIGALDGATVIHASYGPLYGYDGDAVVIFERAGKYYRCHGYHCSCNGLEEVDWQPEEISVEEAALYTGDAAQA